MSTTIETFVAETTKTPFRKRADRRRARRDWPHGRLAVTDGVVSVMKMNTRNPWVRRCLDIMGAHLSDLGGLANASVAQQSTVRRVAALTVELEYLEGEFAKAGHAQLQDMQLYAVVAGKVHKMLETLTSPGMKRVAKDISVGAPRLSELLSREISIEAARNADSNPIND